MPRVARRTQMFGTIGEYPICEKWRLEKITLSRYTRSTENSYHPATFSKPVKLPPSLQFSELVIVSCQQLLTTVGLLYLMIIPLVLLNNASTEAKQRFMNWLHRTSFTSKIPHKLRLISWYRLEMIAISHRSLLMHENALRFCGLSIISITQVLCLLWMMVCTWSAMTMAARRH